MKSYLEFLSKPSVAILFMQLFLNGTIAKSADNNLTATSLQNVLHLETDHSDEDFMVSGELPNTVNSTQCVAATVNRFTGSYHSNLYIGNSSGTNVVLAWGQNMKDYIGTGSGNITTPTTVSSSSYNGIPYEVKSSSSGSSTGYSAMALRTSTKLYFFGTAANLTAITAYSGFGGASLTTAASDVTSKLPSGVAITDIAQMEVSQTAFAIVTNSGHVYVLTKVLNLQGDKAVLGTSTWHHVKLSDGTTFLSGVTKFSLSSSGAFALTGTGKLYYWGAPAYVDGTSTAKTGLNYAYDLSAQIPSGVSVSDVVVLGTKAPSNSTLFILGDNHKVYAAGTNTTGVLGINSSTYTYNQTTFGPVKGTDGTTDLSDIVRIDGNTEADLFTMGAMTSTGKIYGWGDSPAGMLGVPATGASTSSYPVPKTIQLFDASKNYSDFSISGHFTIAFFSNGSTDQYWYLGHNSGGSIGNPANSTQYILAASPATLNSTGGVTFDCSNTQPTILTTQSITAFSSCTGSASAAQTFTISGSSLSGNITVTAPTGYEVSTSAGSGFGASSTVTQSGGTVNNTTIYVRIKSSATGTPAGNITCSSASATDQTIAVSGTVYSLPSAPSDPVDSARTGAGSVTISASASTGETLDWYDASSGGNLLASDTLSFITPSISATTTYFAESRNTTTGCVSSSRTAVNAIINGSFSPGSISSSQSVCSGSAPATINSGSAASGGTGTISYQWQSSTTSTSSGFSDISGATSISYHPAALTQTTYFRRATTTTTPSDGTVYTNAVTVSVNSLPTVTSSTDNSRTGNGTVILNATASSGSTLDWYANSSGGSYLSGGNGVTTFVTPSISITTTYFAEARNTTTGCVSSSRTPVTATINGSFSPGSISVNQIICGGYAPATLSSSSSASGGTGTISYQWQSSTTSDTSGFTDISGAISATYTPGALNQTTYFRRSSSTTTPSDGTVYTSPVMITVNAATSKSITQAACTNYTLNGTTYNSSGDFIQTLTNAAGCDSVITLHLTINSAVTNSQTLALCAGENVTVGSNTYSSSGTYTDVLTAANGCDSTVTIYLTVNSAITSSQTLSLCAGQDITVGSNTYSSSGTYTDVLTAANGCDSTVTTYLTINLAINTATSLSGPVITADESSAAYQWINCDDGNAIIPGETDQSFMVQQAGNYAVIITQNSCSDTSACVNVIETKVDDPASDFNASVSPNPFSSSATIRFNRLMDKAELNIFNTCGQLIKTVNNINGNHVKIDRNDMANGIYFTRLIQDGKTVSTVKLVIAEN